MTIQNLTQREVMLSFAYLAYTGELITTPNPESVIAKNINTAIPLIPPLAKDGWKVVWGPSAYTVPGALYQDNLMYVAQNQTDKSQYAVAIRGTNFVSDLDWLMEDFDVLQQLNWPPGATTSSPAGAMISEGASIGLQVLLAMTGSNSSGSNLSLINFLKNECSSGALNICVTGHSLGGMLCGTLALYLQETLSTWDPSKRSNVSSISFAGPTAGNGKFAAHSDTVFSALTPPPNWDTSLGTNMDRVACNLDVAPLAYTGSNLYDTSTSKSAVFSIYDVPGTGTDGVKGIDFSNMGWGSIAAWGYIETSIFPVLVSGLSKQNYTQVQSSATPLQGTFKSLLAMAPPIDIKADDSLLAYMKGFAAQGAYQHSDSYPTILGVSELLNPKIIIRD